MSKVIKQMQMDAIKATFQDVKDLVILSFHKVSCATEGQFRTNLRKKKIRLQMVKNSYTRRVFNDLGIRIPVESPVWAGTTVFAWGAGSVSELCRDIEGELKDAKRAPQYKDKISTAKGAITEGQVIPFEQAIKLPTRQEALSMVLGQILGPAANLVAAMQGPAGTVAGQVKTKGEEKEEGAAPAEAAPPA